MIIGIDASIANAESKTGTEWYSYILLKKFSEIDRKNEYRLYVENSPDQEFFNLGKNFQVKVLKWPINRFWHQGRLGLEMLFNKPDVLFVPAHTIPLLHPVKTITTCHDVGFEQFPELYTATERQYHRWSMRLAVKRANRIITVSHFSKQEIIKYYQADPDKIIVIYHGVDKDFYSRPAQSKINHTLSHFNIMTPYILFIGRLEKKKNIINQIKAFNLLKEKHKIIHQLVLGGNPGFGSEAIKEEIAKSPYKKDIKQIGYVNEEYLPSLYSGADLFWFITNYEGFGLPVLEAQACQTPVIASDACSLKEVGGRGVGLVKPNNIEEITRVSYDILSDCKKKACLIQYGLENIKRFDWNECANKTLEYIINNK